MRLLFLSLIAILLISGCTGSQTPEERFQELLLKGATLPDGHYTYQTSFGLGDETAQQLGNIFLGSLSVDVDVYSVNGETKTLVTLTGFGITTAVFQKGETMITCVEAPIAGLGDGITCSTETTTFNPFSSEQLIGPLTDIVSELDITLVGQQTTGGRTCDQFQFSIDASLLADAFGDMLTGAPFDQVNDIIITYDLCLDSQHGFIVSADMDISQFSELAGENRDVMTISMTLEQWNPSGASAEDVQLPVSFAVQSASCSDQELSVTLMPFVDVSGDLVLTLSEYSLSSGEQEVILETTIADVSLTEGREHVEQLAFSEEVGYGMYTVKACIGPGDCAVALC